MVGFACDDALYKLTFILITLHDISKRINFSLLLDFGVSLADVFGADAGLDGNVLVRESDPRVDVVAVVERFVVTMATLARRLSVTYNMYKDMLTQRNQKWRYLIGHTSFPISDCY